MTEIVTLKTAEANFENAKRNLLVLRRATELFGAAYIDGNGNVVANGCQPHCTDAMFLNRGFNIALMPYCRVDDADMDLPDEFHVHAADMIVASIIPKYKLADRGDDWIEFPSSEVLKSSNWMNHFKDTPEKLLEAIGLALKSPMFSVLCRYRKDFRLSDVLEADFFQVCAALDDFLIGDFNYRHDRHYRRNEELIRLGDGVSVIHFDDNKAFLDSSTQIVKMRWQLDEAKELVKMIQEQWSDDVPLKERGSVFPGGTPRPFVL